MTWPLSAQAVEAAARKRYDRMNRFRIMAPESQGLWKPPAWEELEPRAKHKIMQDMAEDLGEAIAAWEPSEGQVAQFKRMARAEAVTARMGENGDMHEARCTRAGLLAAVRTETPE